jgi:hypothetical protein
MAEKKNKRLAVLTAVLLAAVAVTWLSGTSGAGMDVNKQAFHVEDFTLIDRVEMEWQGKSIVLTYANRNWTVNGNFDADRDMVRVLFATLSQVEPQRPVNAKRRDATRAFLSKDGVHIKLFAGSDLKLAFDAGGNQQKSEAWYQTATEGPYVMGIPGYRVYAAGVFEQDLIDWREKLVFDFNWRSFQRLEANFPKEPAQNFSITLSESIPDVVEMAGEDTTKVNDYLDAVSLLTVARFYKPGQSKKFDSLSAVPLSFSIRVSERGGKVHSLDLFPPVRGEQAALGRWDDALVFFDRNDIIQIAKKKNYFLPSPN